MSTFVTYTLRCDICEQAISYDSHEHRPNLAPVVPGRSGPFHRFDVCPGCETEITAFLGELRLKRRHHGN